MRSAQNTCVHIQGQALLGYRSGRITTHYSATELSRLIDAVNSVCAQGEGKSERVVLRRLSISNIS